MKQEKFDFYDKTSLKSYNLDTSMRYQLNMLDSLDVYTRKHCENVASITCRLCEYLHCKKDFIEYCTICAYLHDIGKMFIPPKILQKNEPLTDEEYEVMKTHTTIGYKMCMGDKKLMPYAIGAKCHHEALNGTGYPEGLSGNDIPYEAQIIRVADEYDAIVSKRQYKSHIDISDTIKILIENSQPLPKTNPNFSKVKNPHFGKNNPKIVKALIKVVIDDTEYEISCMFSYIDYLKENIKRLKNIKKYDEKRLKAKKDKEKSYYEEGMKMLFSDGETIENYLDILAQYEEALINRTDILNKLFEEVKKIKKLKV